MNVLCRADCLRAALAACCYAEAKLSYVIDYTRIIDFVNGCVICDLSKLSCAVTERIQ